MTNMWPICDQYVACVASVSVVFGMKELQREIWLSPHFPRRQNTKNPVPRLCLLPNPTETLATQSKGPDALDWQNLFVLSKILDKICLCQISNLLNVGALRHSQIYVNHTEINTIALHAVRGKDYIRSQGSCVYCTLRWFLPLRSNVLPRHII